MRLGVPTRTPVDLSRVPDRPTRTPVDLSRVPDPSLAIPLVDLPTEGEMRHGHGETLVAAFKHTGFVRVRAPGALTRGCAKTALQASAELLRCAVDELILGVPKKHSVEGGKEYVFLRPVHVARDPQLREMYVAVCDVKRRVLRGLELGLDLPPGSLLDRHPDEADTLRLFRYPLDQTCEGPAHIERCCVHRDYGTSTIFLLLDGPGQEVWHKESNAWYPLVATRKQLDMQAATVLKRQTTPCLQSTSARSSPNRPRSPAGFPSPDTAFLAPIPSTHSSPPTSS